jgi:hypothetical protein
MSTNLNAHVVSYAQEQAKAAQDAYMSKFDVNNYFHPHSGFSDAWYGIKGHGDTIYRDTYWGIINN